MDIPEANLLPADLTPADVFVFVGEAAESMLLADEGGAVTLTSEIEELGVVEIAVMVVCWIAEVGLDAAEIAVCGKDNGAVDAFLLTTEERPRFGFCPGNVSFGKATPSEAQSLINATDG